MIREKHNVEVFNENVLDNGGYLYTTNAQLSSTLSNKRISDEVVKMIGQGATSIIDAGCGDGSYTLEIAQHFPNSKVSGFDPASKAIMAASARNKSIHFFVGNILDPETIKGQFAEVAVIRGVLHHLSDPELAIRNSRNLCDRLIIVEPNGNNPILKIIEKVSPYHREHEEQSFSSQLLRKWCERNGFTVHRLDYIGFIPFFFPTFLTRIIYSLQPFLERFFLLRKYFGAQIVISATRNK